MTTNTLSNEQIQTLREIQGEIQACFDGWDGAIDNGRQPVPIQDLDHWSKQLTTLIASASGRGLGDLFTDGKVPRVDEPRTCVCGCNRILDEDTERAGMHPECD